MTQNIPVEELCRDIQMQLPDSLWRLDKLTRYQRGRYTEDFATFDESYYYIFGVVEVPLTYTQGETFTWGVWVQVTHDEHDQYLARFQTPEAENCVFTGTLANDIPGYPDALGASVRVQCRETRRPELTLLSSSLAQAQQKGLDEAAHRRLDTILFGDDDDEDSRDDLLA